MRSCFGTEPFPSIIPYSFFFLSVPFSCRDLVHLLKDQGPGSGSTDVRGCRCLLRVRVRRSPVGISFGSRLGRAGSARSRSVLSGVEK